MSYEIGSRIGDYEILQILGAGGMGRVYKVRNVISDRTEAMKVLLPDLQGNPSLADRFIREIKVQASLDHPNIAGLHTAQRIDNQLVMLMEFVEGATLDKMMESGPLPIGRAADYIVQVLSGLAYAHARGVVHRDLKPANMMVTPSGVVKLMDFGIAKMAADRKLTQTGSTVGSLYYMSPEQIKGVLDLDPRSDLYSLGVSLYEIVTGARPFQGDSEYSIMAAHLQSNPPPPIQISPNLPPGLNEVILQALEKDPANRFQTADAFRNALLSVCKGVQAAPSAAPPVVKTAQPVQAPPPPVASAAQAQPGRSRRGLWVALGAVIALLVIVAAAIQLPRFRRAAAESAPPEAGVTAQPPAESQTPGAFSAGTAVESGPAGGSIAAFETAQSESAAPSQTASTVPLAPKAADSAPPAAATRAGAAQPASQAGTTSTVKSTRSAARAESIQQSGSDSARMETARSFQTTPSVLAEDPKAAEQLKEVREQLNLLSIRAEGARSSLETLRRQQAGYGLGLRADMANAAQRMEMYLGQTQTALRERDAEAAKKSLDSAEREVSRLEDFLHK
jgi:serine/threonine-protein kinase